MPFKPTVRFYMIEVVAAVTATASLELALPIARARAMGSDFLREPIIGSRLPVKHEK